MKKTFVVVILFLASLAQVSAQVTFIVDVLPQNTPPGEVLYIAGDFTGWNPGLSGYALVKNEQDKWEITLDARPTGSIIQFKFTRGSWETVEKGAAGEELPNRTFTFGNGETIHVDILNWADNGGGAGSTASENVLVMADDFFMPQLNRSRRIWIYLPPDYESSGLDYPVIYMHDGQNLFDNLTSFSGEWCVDETLNLLSQQGYRVPIVVGIDNGGTYRIAEYTPWSNPQYGGGEGEPYINFIVETLKPTIDNQYRTLADREHTAIMGSSLGGLISHYGSLSRQDVFGKAGIFSPSYWFSDSVWFFTHQAERQQKVRFYQLCGTLEGGNTVDHVLRMSDSLMAAGFESSDVYNKVVTGGQHNEALWKTGFGEAYLWLFGDYAAGVDKIDANHRFLCFPNPVSGELAFDGFAAGQIDSLAIYNVHGQKVIYVKGLPENKLDVQSLTPGVYVVVIHNGQTLLEGKFLKQ